jgi:DNA-binding transcriptional MerR regulator
MKLLINESPLQVLPTLACKVGLNEAIVLQQIHYWLNPDYNKNVRDERHWVFNTLEGWKKQFSFWSDATIKRTFKSLVEQGLLIRNYFSDNRFEKTPWYTIEYPALLALEEDLENTQSTANQPVSDRKAQNDPSIAQIDPSIAQSNLSAAQNDPFEQLKMIRSAAQNELSLKEITKKITLKDSLSTSQADRTQQNNVQQNERELIFSQMLSTFEEIVLGAPLQSTLDYRKALWKVYQEQLGGDLSLWQDVCQKIVSSSFLMGESKNTNFKPTLSWFLKGDNVRKILAGEWVMGDRVVKTTNNPQHELKDILQQIDASLEPTVIKSLKRFVIEHTSLAVFKSWFAAVEGTVQDNQVILVCPTGFVKDRIASDYGHALQTFLHQQGYTLSLTVHQPTTQGCH